MRALRFHAFGTPDTLGVEVVSDPTPDPDHAVVAVRAASINPSDVANVAGRFPRTTLPRTPGRDYAGVVVAGPSDWLGAAVWGTGDAGFAFDGSHAERIRVPVASLRRKPPSLTDAEAASVGVNFVTAFLGVADYAQLRAGETLAVIGASGGVGGAAIQIGRRIGARVIAIHRAAPHADPAVAAMAESVVAASPDRAAALVRELTGGRGADVVLNTVGGDTFEPSLGMLAHRGRLAVLASPGGRRQSLDLLDFYHNESRLFGVDTLARDGIAAADLLDALAPGFADGDYRAPVIAEHVGLDDAAAAYARVAAGSRGRVVLVPGLS